MSEENFLTEHQKQIAFIQKQIICCQNNIQKNLKEMKNVNNKSEIEILKDTNRVLKIKTEYLKKELKK